MSVLLRSHHKQFYPEDLSVFAPFPWQFSLDYKLKLAPKFKDFPAPTTIFKIFFTIFILKFTDFPGLSRCVRTLTETLNILVYTSLKTEELSKPGLTL